MIHRRRSAWLFWSGLVGVCLVVVAVLWAVDTRADQVQALADALRAEQAQTRDRGDEPAAPPPEDIVRDPSVIEGPRGQGGRPGRGITDVRIIADRWVVIFDDGTTRDLGPIPTPSPGASGKPGQSPPCLSEPRQCRGEKGTDGEDGDKGDKGDKGEPPASWTWTDPATGRTYRCARDEGSPDSAPTYTCPADPMPSPSPSEDIP